MYANYNQPSTLNALRLRAHGIEKVDSLCPDLISTPSSYYPTPCTAYTPPTKDEFWRVKLGAERSITICNDPDTDPMLKAALAHRIVMEDVSALIEDTDRKFLSYMGNAIIRGDLVSLTQVLNGIAENMPHKLEAYVRTLACSFKNTGSGVCIGSEGISMILVHLYHGNCAIAIDPTTKSVSVLPIFTDWDGTVFVANGEVISPTAEGLMENIQRQSVCRILMQYESGDGESNTLELPVVHELAA